MIVGIAPSRADQVTVTAGGDDDSYLIPDTTIVYQGVTYTNSVYITTNSVITFGAGSTTYNTYPNLPSISFNSIDWVQYPNIRPDEHLIITTYSGGFQIDLAGRPFPNDPNGNVSIDNPNFDMSVQPLTNIIITATIDANGEASYTFSVSGPDYATTADYFNNTQRTGARTAPGAAVVSEGAAEWPSFRVTRVFAPKADPLVSVTRPELLVSDGKLSCSAGAYRFSSGSTADIHSVVYTLVVNNEPVSRIAYDTASAVAPHMFAPITQTISGVATKEMAMWDVSNLSNFDARCEVSVIKSGAMFNALSNEFSDSVKVAAANAKAQAWEDQRASATAANFTQQAREMRKRIAARSGN
jgi:hypothetical protein